jgi:ATP-dependent Clp protease ATP-binding subunit ClpB
MKMLRGHFRPEFLNRVDETVMFKPLSQDEITGVVELLLKDLRERLARQQIVLDLDDAAAKFIAHEGYDPVYGARPLKRFIQHHLETPISRMIIAGKLPESATVRVGVEQGELVLR